MTVLSWVAVIAAVWFAIAIPAALALGRLARNRRRHPRPVDQPADLEDHRR